MVPGRRQRACPGLRYGRRLGDRQIRPARDQYRRHPWGWRHAAPGTRRGQSHRHGDGAQQPHPQRRRSPALRAGEPGRAARALPRRSAGAGDAECRRAPLAVRLGKQAVNLAFESFLSAGLADERRLFYFLFASQDQKRGYGSFSPRSAPRSGRVNDRRIVARYCQSVLCRPRQIFRLCEAPSLSVIGTSATEQRRSKLHPANKREIASQKTLLRNCHVTASHSWCIPCTLRDEAVHRFISRLLHTKRAAGFATTCFCLNEVRGALWSYSQ